MSNAPLALNGNPYSHPSGDIEGCWLKCCHCGARLGILANRLDLHSLLWKPSPKFVYGRDGVWHIGREGVNHPHPKWQELPQLVRCSRCPQVNRISADVLSGSLEGAKGPL